MAPLLNSQPNTSDNNVGKTETEELPEWMTSLPPDLPCDLDGSMQIRVSIASERGIGRQLSTHKSNDILPERKLSASSLKHHQHSKGRIRRQLRQRIIYFFSEFQME